MYEAGGSGGGPLLIGSGVAAVVLPVTGGANSVVAIAAAVFSGLIVWGVSYSILNR